MYDLVPPLTVHSKYYYFELIPYPKPNDSLHKTEHTTFISRKRNILQFKLIFQILINNFVRSFYNTMRKSCNNVSFTFFSHSIVEKRA